MKTYEFKHDPGHGWLAVHLSELHDLGIADKISDYSYYNYKNDMVWLEEDCDMTHFFNAKGWDSSAFSDGTIKSKYVSRTTIRSMPRFHPEQKIIN
jgi:hypothetical protein